MSRAQPTALMERPSLLVVTTKQSNYGEERRKKKLKRTNNTSYTYIPSKFLGSPLWARQHSQGTFSFSFFKHSTELKSRLFIYKKILFLPIMMFTELKRIGVLIGAFLFHNIENKKLVVFAFNIFVMFALYWRGKKGKILCRDVLRKKNPFFIIS